MAFRLEVGILVAVWERLMNALSLQVGLDAVAQIRDSEVV